MSSLFPNLLSIPEDIDTKIAIRLDGEKFAFDMKTNEPEYEKILVSFLADFNGFLSRIALCSRNETSRNANFLLSNSRINAGIVFDTHTRLAINSENKQVCKPYFVCAMPTFFEITNLKMIPYQSYPESIISFVRYATTVGYVFECFASYAPEKYALSISPSVNNSFAVFRHVIYSAIASERIFFSDIPMDAKFAEIYYCSFVRFLKEYGTQEAIKSYGY